jgi:hypothetical protein
VAKGARRGGTGILNLRGRAARVRSASIGGKLPDVNAGRVRPSVYARVIKLAWSRHDSMGWTA